MNSIHHQHQQQQPVDCPAPTEFSCSLEAPNITASAAVWQGNLQLLSCGMWGDVTVWSVNEMSEADVVGTSEVRVALRLSAAEEALGPR